MDLMLHSGLEVKLTWSFASKPYQKYLLSDAQTSGGLLISCSKDKSQQLVKKLNDMRNIKSSIIGEVVSKQNKILIIS